MYHVKRFIFGVLHLVGICTLAVIAACMIAGIFWAIGRHPLMVLTAIVLALAYQAGGEWVKR